MLKLDKVCLDYGNGKGVHNISFSVRYGKIIGVLGSNGCGKTTTFRILLGLLEANSGDITLDKQALNRKDTKIFGYLPEERSMMRNLTVFEQVSYLSRLKKMNDDEIEINLDYWLKYLKIEEYKHMRISELSKGNQQKVQMVCALIHNPKVVIFDEPLNGLDIDNVELFKSLLMKLRKEKKIILISSHQYNNIEQYCDFIVYLNNGKILFKGEVNKLKKKSGKYYLKINTDDNTYTTSKGVIDHKRDGKYLILEFKESELCYRVINLLLKDNIDDFSLELSSLKDIIKEKLK